jgi:uroporphyrinogen decarboxylase
MDTYLKFPVETHDDFRELKKRYVAQLDERYPANWKDLVPEWKRREHVLVLGRNCAACGFYWRAREWMGTENLSFAWYDDPDLAHDMMEFFADFTIEVAKPILAEIDAEYFVLNEDFAGKGGPLLGPEIFKEFVFKPLKRLVDFLKSHGVRYIALDSDGNTEPLIPLMMDAGIDVHWPLERASEMDPIRLRKKYGKALRLWGGVDKRELAKGPKAIEAHLRELAPLVEEGGFIPTVDHTVPPDVSWGDFCYYMGAKRRLLEGKL